MPIVFPSSPSIDDEFFAGGKAYKWNGSYWIRFFRAIIDGGFSTTEITDVDLTADGGDA